VTPPPAGKQECAMKKLIIIVALIAIAAFAYSRMTATDDPEFA